MMIARLGEFGLIDVVKRFCPVDGRVVVGIGDDAAVLAFSATQYQTLTTDMMAEHVHFNRQMPASQIGHKAMACNISDIAAMGGVPTFAVVSLALPSRLPVKWVKDFYRGMGQVARDFGVVIVGGDTIKSDDIVINVALLGTVDKKHLVLRSGAKVGDTVFVTGPLGGSFKSGRHLTFTPRLQLAQFLVKHYKPSAMMDISDGLAGDLNHLLAQSQVGVSLDEPNIPKHKGVSLKQALTEGEDYELLFTLSSRKTEALMTWQAKKKATFFPIGRIIKDTKARVAARGFTHF